MKTKFFTISLLIGLSLATGAIGAPVSAAGGGARVTTQVAPTAPVRTITPGTTAPGNPPTSQPVNPSVSRQFPTTQTLTGSRTTNTPTVSPTNELAMTNGLPGNSNMTANASNQANGNIVIQDQAITPGDRVLLTTLQQGVAAQLGVTTMGALPVHFMINNGAVTLLGIVPTADDSQRIFARVHQTPGVLSVFNDLHVGSPPTAVQPRNNLVGGAGITDHAFSAADRTLLTVVEQAVGNQLGVNGASSAQMPVHFSVQEGVVGVTGQLSSPQEKAAILDAVQKTPGVVRVVDNVALVNVPQNGSLVPNPMPQNPAMNNQPLPPTGRSMGLTNSLFLNSTNQSQ